MSDVNKRKLVVLVSMDGVGVAPPSPGNAVTLAQTPNLDKLWPTYPHTFLEASGVHVGLPPGTDGNSEVGHTIMGAGKVIYQDVARIDNAILNKSFFENPELKGAFAHAQKYNSAVHVIGLVGHGKSHSALNHLFALIKMATFERFDPERFYIHAIGDGRDSPPDRLADYLDEVNNQCISLKMGRVVSIVGRFYAMDRDKRWDRIEAAYNLYTKGAGRVVNNARQAIEESYAKDKHDEFIEPLVIVDKQHPQAAVVKENDVVIFFNFRPDRATQITKAFAEEDFVGFERAKINNLYYLGMTKYTDTLPPHVAFPPDKAINHLGRVLSDNKVAQLRVAESEKFAHVTYFFNNGQREALAGEVQLEVPSPKDVLTYDQKPDMSMRWATDVFLEKISSGKFGFGLINFAGPDMVGHTGHLKSTITAMQTTDECIGRIVAKVVDELDGAVIITADHGNAEEMINPETNAPDTDHTTNQVPCLIIQQGLLPRELAIGNLADIAPTVLGLLGIRKPAEMTGRDLLHE
jgi:2,3-bisphosphoglycerate-independent phosphoglycerate mutase